MPTDPKKPLPDEKPETLSSQVKKPVDGDEGSKNIEEEGEPFDGNFA